jgi:hypothetical protein
MEVLKLVKMGCDFGKGDLSVVGSDCENYRLRLAEPITDKSGVIIEGDFMRGYKYRFYSKNGGARLKKAVVEHEIRLVTDLAYYKDNDRAKNECYGYRCFDLIAQMDLLYTQADILRFVNEITGKNYDKILIIEKECKKI